MSLGLQDPCHPLSMQRPGRGDQVGGVWRRGLLGTLHVSAQKLLVSSPCRHGGRAGPFLLAEQRSFRSLSPFTASATHGILELEHLSQTHRRFHTVFESQNLSIWSLSQNPRILESQDHLWTHGPESRRIKESLEKTWSLTHSLLDPWNRSINPDKPGIETVTLKSEP